MTPTFAAIATALIAGAVAITKKMLPRKDSPRPELITRLEFHQAMDILRDKLDARLLAISEKIEALAISVHTRLTELESTVARLDERTKK
jgi:hypothetical protein